MTLRQSSVHCISRACVCLTGKHISQVCVRQSSVHCISRACVCLTGKHISQLCASRGRISLAHTSHRHTHRMCMHISRAQVSHASRGHMRLSANTRLVSATTQCCCEARHNTTLLLTPKSHGLCFAHDQEQPTHSQVSNTENQVSGFPCNQAQPRP